MDRALIVKNMHELSKSQFAALQDLKAPEHLEVLGKSFKKSIQDWESAQIDQVLGLCFLFEGQYRYSMSNRATLLRTPGND